jgi:hypothetical protein
MRKTDYETYYASKPSSLTYKTNVSKKAIVLLVIVTVAAIFLRIGYHRLTIIENPALADAFQYVIYGMNLVQHGTFSKDYPTKSPRPDSYRSPGYPVFIALAMLLGGENAYPVICYTQIMVSGLMVPLTFFLGILFLPLWGAMTAAALVALSPHLVASASYVLTETLFGFVFLCSVLLFCNAVRKRSHLLFISSGACFGYAYLINETALVIPFSFFGIALASEGRGYKRVFQHPFLSGAAWFLVVFCLFPVGWMIRNRTNVPPDAPNGKQRALMTLTHGAYPGFVYKDPRYKYYPYKEDPEQPAYSASLSQFAAIFWGRFRQRPARYLAWYLFEKPYYLWSWNILQGQGDVYIYPVAESLYHQVQAADVTRELMKHLHPIILVLACFAFLLFCVLHCRKKAGVSVADTPILPLITILAYTFIHMVFAPWPRYSIPLRPELYLCSVWTVAVVARFGGIHFMQMTRRNRLRDPARF